MKTLRRALVAGTMALALGGVVVPAASAATAGTQPAPLGGISVQKTWHATVQCQIVRIRDNHVVGYDRADGSGNSKQDAINDAKANVPVPAGHYKRHCDVKRLW
ncbi:hypothetical protein AB0C51_11205 [Streptomyces pathocidini]|uniref:Uncharacterized protein n=1 Tax=Streptomyces pathocidini TaxID=1650571 RepID=A0ABW7UU56_9ACTN|nr:hypothetical protein [Streptomyces pathocidini]